MSDKVQMRFIQTYADRHGGYIEGRIYDLTPEHAEKVLGVAEPVNLPADGKPRNRSEIIADAAHNSKRGRPRKSEAAD